MLGYKVMNYIESKARSGANSEICFAPVIGKTVTMPGRGIFLSLDKHYVINYYSVHDKNILITFDFNVSDIVGRGSLKDKDTEFSVKSAKIVDFEILGEE